MPGCAWSVGRLGALSPECPTGQYSITPGVLQCTACAAGQDTSPNGDGIGGTGAYSPFACRGNASGSDGEAKARRRPNRPAALSCGYSGGCGWRRRLQKRLRVVRWSGVHRYGQRRPAAPPTPSAPLPPDAAGIERVGRGARRHYQRVRLTRTQLRETASARSVRRARRRTASRAPARSPPASVRLCAPTGNGARAELDWSRAC